eukprot:4943894-Pyramimonas_sp.AAC.1
MQRSELGLLLELGPRIYSYRSSHLNWICRFAVLNLSSRGSTELIRAETDSESSCAFVCCIQRSQLGLLLGLGPQNYMYSSSRLDRSCPFVY